jgi:thioredoxin reductase
MHATKTLEYVVLGAGPGGLQMAHHLASSGHDYLVLERGDGCGHFYRTFPRHRRLLSINKPYTGFTDPEKNLRWDWNSILGDENAPRFTDRSEDYFPPAELMSRYLDDYARAYGLKVRLGTEVAAVTREAEGFHLRATDGSSYRCRSLIVATGNARPYVPPIPGIELVEEYGTVSVEPRDFVNQRVLIIGKGNSGFETAQNLIASAALMHLASPSSVKHAWKTHHPGHLRATNNEVCETYRLKSQNALIDAEVRSIRPAEGGGFVATFAYIHADDEVEELQYDRVISCAGFRFDTTPFEAGCRLDLTLNDRFPAMTSWWESTNVPHLYFAGALMQPRDWKKAATAFIHGFRYNVRALHHVLEVREHGRPWPYRTVPANPEALAGAMLDRVNTSSGLWQQFGYLCDLVVVPDDGGPARYYEEVPHDLVEDFDWGGRGHYYKLTLEYGDDPPGADPFAVPRMERHDVRKAAESTGLHPIVRHYRDGELAYEHHVIEDFITLWDGPEHFDPLSELFRTQLTAAVTMK